MIASKSKVLPVLFKNQLETVEFILNFGIKKMLRLTVNIKSKCKRWEVSSEWSWVPFLLSQVQTYGRIFASNKYLCQNYQIIKIIHVVHLEGEHSATCKINIYSH